MTVVFERAREEWSVNKSLLWVFALAAFGASRADAAFITIDGSNLASITITAGDFEDGLGESAANTLPDASHTIPGSWIDEGAANGASLDVLFALAVLPTDVTSGITFDATSDGFFASLVGSL